MPELPEVETITRFLKKKIRGKRIIDVELVGQRNRAFRDHDNFADIRSFVAGRRIANIARKGKEIIFQLSGGACLVFHLMMTGKILLNPSEQSPHDRVKLTLAGGNVLVFNDVRKFGRCRLERTLVRFEGKDALSISRTDFINAVRSRQASIKTVLLNQKIVAGIGNIYADEILWYAGVNPARSAKDLTEKEIGAVYKEMGRVLLLAVKMGGTTSRNYRKPDGSSGSYYDIRRAYHRTGEKCRRDGSAIVRIVLGGRSTHYCPKHQR